MRFYYIISFEKEKGQSSIQKKFFLKRSNHQMICKKKRERV